VATLVLLTYQDVAQIARVDPRTVQRWVKRFNLRVIRPTKCTVRLPAATVEKLIGQPVPYQSKVSVFARPA
jgi:predicted site-specific integrase-resolvase